MVSLSFFYVLEYLNVFFLSLFFFIIPPTNITKYCYEREQDRRKRKKKRERDQGGMNKKREKKENQIKQEERKYIYIFFE